MISNVSMKIEQRIFMAIVLSVEKRRSEIESWFSITGAEKTRRERRTSTLYLRLKKLKVCEIVKEGTLWAF